MKTSYGDEFVLALTMFREASNQGSPGMIAVGYVVKNRAEKWGGSIYEQCVAHNQFSSMVIRGDPSTVRWPKDDDPVWLKCISAAKGIILGIAVDPTRGALYYYNHETATSGWFKENIANNPTEHPLVATIGAHQFFA